jgi:hypothetical protein
MFSNIITKIKHTILVDETLPKEEIKKQLKKKVYSLLIFSLVFSLSVFYLTPHNIMQHNWAQNFVDIMSYIVPMVDTAEIVRVNGPDDEKTLRLLQSQGLIVAPHISFYYAVMWVWNFFLIPLVLYFYRKNFIYIHISTDRIYNKVILNIKNIIFFILSIVMIIYIYIYIYFLNQILAVL